MSSDIFFSTEGSGRVRMLLPYSFKKIGLAIFFICLFQSLIYTWLKPDFFSKDLSTGIKQYGSLFGLFLFAWAQYKVETEKTVSVKVKALLISVLFSFGYFFVSPLIDMIFMDTVEEIKARSLLFNLLFFYIVNEWMMRDGKL